MTTTKPVSELARKLAERIFDLHEAGRIMHESWTVTKRSQGFHGPNEPCVAAQYDLISCHPLAPCKTFHADLIPWDDLPQKQKDINLNAFKDVFAALLPKSELGFEQMAALTRKQTLEECAITAEKFAGNCNWSDACLVHERIAAAIREMEVKA